MDRETIDILTQDALLLCILALAAWKLDAPAWADLLAILLLSGRTSIKLGVLDKIKKASPE